MNRHRQSGVALLEALVTAVLLGIGLLSLASLQIKALQGATEAEHRRVATDLAWTLADRIRANLPADTATGHAYVSDPPASCAAPAGLRRCSMAAGAGSASGVQRCSPAEMAAWDLYTLRCDAASGVRARLPGGRLTVTCVDADPGDSDTCSTGSELRITVRWTTRGDLLGSASANTGTERVTLAVVPGADQGVPAP